MAYKYSYGYEEEKKYEPPKLPTNRSVWKLAILSILTLGVYTIFFFIPLASDLNKVDPKRGREKTMNYFTAWLIGLFTFSFGLALWHYHIAGHIEEALDRRKIRYYFSTGDFWGWYIFGSFILIGPFVYFYKLCKAMNLLCASYNEKPVLDA